MRNLDFRSNSFQETNTPHDQKPLRAFVSSLISGFGFILARILAERGWNSLSTDPRWSLQVPLTTPHTRKAFAMIITSIGFVTTAKADRYIQQLVKHWSHKLDIDCRDGVARIPFNSDVHLALETRNGGIAMTLTSPSDEADVRFRKVFEQHLDRFAFREAPLAYDWTRSRS
jgi:hypothetical protein